MESVVWMCPEWHLQPFLPGILRLEFGSLG